MITRDTLRDMLDYDPCTGIFTWKKPPSRKYRVGSRAGGLSSFGYRMICLHYRRYQEHRLAWLYVHGVWPTHEIDHIDRNKTNNAIANLRDVPREVNMWNRGPRKNNACGIVGVYFHKQSRLWHARIETRGKTKSLGYFATKEDAQRARETAEAARGAA